MFYIDPNPSTATIIPAAVSSIDSPWRGNRLHRFPPALKAAANHIRHKAT